MNVGFAVLAHERFDRAKALVQHLASSGAPVAVHVDTAVPIETRKEVEARLTPHATCFSMQRTEWGRFGLVAASLALAEHLLSRSDSLSHVCLLSGACLPIRPLDELAAHLSERPGVDFIESVPVANNAWVQDGLSGERFTLRHPFSHRRHPRLFSLSIEVQRALKLRRRMPVGLSACLGQQWWCLSRQSLELILNHPKRQAWEKFFRTTWIPDESFFQTLVKAVRPAVVPSAPLHLGGFNARGRPHVFHDDHYGMLAGSDRFFARKIDPDAELLYSAFLRPNVPPATARTYCPGSFVQRASDAAAELAEEGRGIHSAGRLPPGATLSKSETVAPYVVLACDTDMQVQRIFPLLKGKATGFRLHGRLFQPNTPAEFAGGGTLYDGNLPSSAVLRDYRPAQFLSRVIWADRTTGTVFFLGAGDANTIRVHLVQDPNARIVFVGGDGREGLRGLAKPFPKRSGKPLAVRAWWRAVPADARAENLTTTANEIGKLLKADWQDPAGWEVPS